MPTTILDNETYPEALQRRYAEETKAEKQAEIIRMAREAGWQYADGDDGYKPLWRFAALVAAHEREQLLANDESLTLAYMVGIREGRLAEREACAKVCDEHGFYGAAPARDIRARGGK